jgi:HAD superfamily hydrolase (TIGR01662 family)
MGPFAGPPLRAVLFDRDGTLIRDVPYNGDPTLVEQMPQARDVLQTLRSMGLAVGVVSNQSGIGRGILTTEQVAAVNLRVEQLLGRFDVWELCPHRPEDCCNCRKPAPFMICDIGADVEAARAAGARGVMVPTPLTLPGEVDVAPEVAVDLRSALCLLMKAPSGRTAS